VSRPGTPDRPGGPRAEAPVPSVQELRPGLWWWEAEHPEWTEADAATEDWGPNVSSYAIDDGERLLLIDPTVPPGPVAALADRRETVIVLTCPWHARDARALTERFAATLYSPPPDSGAGELASARAYAAGDRLPVGIQAFPGMEPNDLVLWVEHRRALVAGDTLIDRGGGFEFPLDWANKGVPAGEILAGLRPLLELPVELVLPSHGPPTDRAALEHALARRP
jgi:glyoxylase-like metal-dependent hydrolase (beta-lactamase superfamily II)